MKKDGTGKGITPVGTENRPESGVGNSHIVCVCIGEGSRKDEKGGLFML